MISIADPTFKFSFVPNFRLLYEREIEKEVEPCCTTIKSLFHCESGGPRFDRRKLISYDLIEANNKCNASVTAFDVMYGHHVVLLFPLWQIQRKIGLIGNVLVLLLNSLQRNCTAYSIANVHFEMYVRKIY